MNSHNTKYITLRRINPRAPEDIALLEQAWRWIHDEGRAQFFPHTGGQQSLDEFLAEALQPTKAYFGIWNGELQSVVVAEVGPEERLLFHLISKRRPDFAAIADGVYQLGWLMFRDLGASAIWTGVPKYRGHWHQGSKRMAEVCGLRPTGRVWREEEMGWTGGEVEWVEYAMTREEWRLKHDGT